MVGGVERGGQVEGAEEEPLAGAGGEVAGEEPGARARAEARAAEPGLGGPVAEIGGEAAAPVVPVAGLVAVGGRLAVAKGVFCGEVDPGAGADEAALAVEGAREGVGASAAGREKTDCAQMFTV